MKYLLIHAVEESRLADEPPQVESELAEWLAEMVGRGIKLDGARLRPVSDATTVRAPGGRVQVTDGPFAETKEQIAGYDVIDCPDLDGAIAVASAHPTLHMGAIEVRAFEAGMPDPEVCATLAEDRRRYLMLVCADLREAMAAAAPSPGEQAGPRPPADDDLIEIQAWLDSVADRRVYGWPLAFPDTAITLRRVDGRVVTTDGPFAETKEQVAGYDLLECRNLDEALAAAGTHPVAAGGVIEIRPLWE